MRCLSYRPARASELAGRRQLLIYHLMFGPTYEAACAGCTGLADGFDGALLHLNNRDITLMAISRAPIEKLVAYKHRMGWQFPYVSSHGSDFNFDFDLLAPYYYQLLDQVPDGTPTSPLRRHDEY